MGEVVVDGDRSFQGDEREGRSVVVDADGGPSRALQVSTFDRFGAGGEDDGPVVIEVYPHGRDVGSTVRPHGRQQAGPGGAPDERSDLFGCHGVIRHGPSWLDWGVSGWGRLGAWMSPRS